MYIVQGRKRQQLQSGQSETISRTYNFEGKKDNNFGTA
jgi:hypothetical protein